MLEVLSLIRARNRCVWGVLLPVGMKQWGTRGPGHVPCVLCRSLGPVSRPNGGLAACLAEAGHAPAGLWSYPGRLALNEIFSFLMF